MIFYPYIWVSPGCKDGLDLTITQGTNRTSPGSTRRGWWSWHIFANVFSDGDVWCSVSPLVNVQTTMENHHFWWENPLFLWPFSIAMFVYQRVWCSKLEYPQAIVYFFKQHTQICIYIYITTRFREFYEPVQECFTIFVVGCLILILHQVYKLWDLGDILSTISGFHVIHMFWGHQHYERKPLNWTTFGINQSCRSQPLSNGHCDGFSRRVWSFFLGNKAAPAKLFHPKRQQCT